MIQAFVLASSYKSKPRPVTVLKLKAKRGTELRAENGLKIKCGTGIGIKSVSWNKLRNSSGTRIEGGRRSGLIASSISIEYEEIDFISTRLEPRAERKCPRSGPQPSAGHTAGDVFASVTEIALEM
ncbi:hypothetical protein EVAR_631_1 [Eumeta japonica]|uniref:Uncharacterized protein n=1 Tax=Eumeta variegata TaxID=151549 RepID=A0A4C1SE35_EUMVA|nr:hypothetical protein EVAR_631_1 [Eumeta japonica]